MLKILSVNPTGFGPYGYHDDVVVNDCGVVWLTGENRDKGGSNGAGKSWFFNVIAQCLWGRVETVIGQSFTGGDELTNEVLGVGMCPRVVFEDAAGVTWRVTCSRKWKAPKKQPSPYAEDSPLWPFKGSDVYLERWDGAKWVDERMSTAPKTRDKVRETVGISYERYLVTTYLAQGKGLDFLRGTHAQRMAIFTDVVNLSLWDAAAAQFKLKRDEATKVEQERQVALAKLQGEFNAITLLTEKEVFGYQVAQEALQKHITEYAAQKTAHEDALVQIAEQIGSIRIGLNPYVIKLQEHDVQARDFLMKCDARVADCHRTRTQAERMHQDALGAIKMRTSPDVCQVQSKLSVAQVALDKSKKTVDDFLSGKLTHCPTCGQELPNKVDGSHLQADLENCSTEVKALQALLEEAKAAHSIAIDGAILQEQMRAQSAEYECAKVLLDAQTVLNDARQRLAVERQAIEEQRAAYDASESSKSKAVADLSTDRDSTQAQITALNKWLSDAAVSMASYEQALKHNEAAKVRKAVLQVDVAAAEQSLSQVRLDVAEWSWLLKNVGDKGLKSFKLEVVCQRLNELIADSLADIDGSFRMWVKPFRLRPGAEDKPEELLTSEDVISEFTVYVQEGGKHAVPAYLYSGGEVSIIALALLVALWQLADEQGSGTNLLLLDEVVGFLDARNSQIVVRFLESLKTAGKTVIAVSHSQVVDSVQFDAVWTVVKQNDISHVERAA